MDIREVHDKLNQKEGDKYRYQLMTAAEINDLFLSCDCPVAIGLGEKVTMTNGVTNSANEQSSIALGCKFAVEGEENPIFTDTKCKLLKMGLCTQHSPRGDLEPGLGVFIYPNP